jgi:hypothetical protein
MPEGVRVWVYVEGECDGVPWETGVEGLVLELAISDKEWGVILVAVGVAVFEKPVPAWSNGRPGAMMSTTGELDGVGTLRLCSSSA